MREGSYTDVAAALSESFDRQFSRQQIELWSRRSTINAVGNPFPGPVRRKRTVPRTRPRVFFDIDAVTAWVRGGIPARSTPGSGKGWIYPQPRECPAPQGC